jgi:transposase
VQKLVNTRQNNQLTIRDLPLGEQAVYLKINRRQMTCQKCGKKFTEELSYVEKKRTYTLRFRKKIVEEVLVSDIKNVAQRNGVSEQEIETMLKDLGKEILNEKPKNLKRLGIDEIALVKGQKNYCAVLVDLDKRIIVGLLEDRTELAITEYLESWGEEVLAQIQEVSIDLWKPYVNVANKLMPQAEVVADRFHVMKQVNDELDRGRRKLKKEAQALTKKKDEKKKTAIISTLNKSKYTLLKNKSDLNIEENNKLEEIYKITPILGMKHELKEEFRDIFVKEKNWVDGLLKLGDWIVKALEYFPDSCGTIRRWIGEIIAYFDNRTTQGVVEGINNKLKLIKRRAYGFRNFDNFKLRSFLIWHFAS